MAKWLEKTLGEVTAFIAKGIPPKYTEKENENTIRVLNQKCNRNFEISYSESRIHDCEKKKVPVDKMLRAGDVLINSTGTGTAGRVAQMVEVTVPTTIDGHMILIRPSEELDPIYYGYAVKSFQSQIEGLAEGSTGQTEINRRRLQDEVIIRYPSDKLVQKNIGSFLANIDEKIKTNKEINKNLLQQLHVLYLRFFCDSAMDTHLGDVVATTSGGTPSRKHDEYYSDSSICWVKSKELLGNYIHETEEHINDLAIKKSSAKLLPEHSVLIAMYGATVGAYGVISKPMTCNQAVCALLCNENYPYTYLFQIAYESQQKFINLAVGSAQQNISQVLIKQLSLHSDLDIIQRFHDLALPMHQEIEFLQAENIRLSDLRDNLLPKLMSGELDVSNVEI